VGNVINLNKFRKAKERAEKAALAEQNRRKHGRTAAERAREHAERARLEAELTGKHLDPEK
jgi:hypothetical protein